jgi:CheY-like chemotaxis protein
MPTLTPTPRVLFVDDDERVLLAAETVLDDPGFELVVARSGEEALQALMGGDFAAVVLDVVMPGMNGLDVARWIRQYSRTRDLPLLFVTAYAQDDESVRQAYDLDALDFISKPFSPAVLRAKLKTICRLRCPPAPEEERRDGPEKVVAALAHELQGPVGILRKGLRELDQAGDKLPSLQRAADQLHRFVQHALEVSGGRRGRLAARLVEASLAPIVAEAAAEAGQALVERGHHLSIVSPAAPVRLNADAERLVQAVRELLENAARHTPRGGHIVLSFGDEDGEAWIRVQDDGYGIDANLMPHLFDLYSLQGPVTQGLGLGLGLGRVREIALLHGGRAMASSEGPGQGSTFELRWPARPQEPAHVLMVDDHDDVLDSTVALLRYEGFLVQQASSGREGLELASAQRFDAILLDLAMPGLDGFETAALLSQRLGRDMPPLVAVTGFGSAIDRARTTAAGFREHLVKPVEAPDLARVLWRLIGQTRRAEAG